MKNYILNIDTSNDFFSVALSIDNQCIDEIKSTENQRQAEQLTPCIKHILDRQNLVFAQLKAIAISRGPGSYTGLRIGTSVAKGICFAQNIPLIGIDTLQILTQGLLDRQTETLTPQHQLCPLIDARRMEVFAAVYDHEGKEKKKVYSQIFDSQFVENAQNEPLTNIYFGSGAGKLKPLLAHTKHIFVEQNCLWANHMITLANQKYIDKDFENLAYFEPLYAKNFFLETKK